MTCTSHLRLASAMAVIIMTLCCLWETHSFEMRMSTTAKRGWTVIGKTWSNTGANAKAAAPRKANEVSSKPANPLQSASSTISYLDALSPPVSKSAYKRNRRGWTAIGKTWSTTGAVTKVTAPRRPNDVSSTASSSVSYLEILSPSQPTVYKGYKKGWTVFGKKWSRGMTGAPNKLATSNNKSYLDALSPTGPVSSYKVHIKGGWTVFGKKWAPSIDPKKAPGPTEASILSIKPYLEVLSPSQPAAGPKKGFTPFGKKWSGEKPSSGNTYLGALSLSRSILANKGFKKGWTAFGKKWAPNGATAKGGSVPRASSYVNGVNGAVPTQSTKTSGKAYLEALSPNGSATAASTKKTWSIVGKTWSGSNINGSSKTPARPASQMATAPRTYA